MQNYKGLGSVLGAGELCQFACGYGSEDSVFPQGLGDRGLVLPDDNTAKEWLPDP